MSYPLRKISIDRGRELTATPVFDTYWRFAAKRQEVFFRRVKGAKPPWTNDPVIAGYRFTNAYRAADRVSQYLIRHVIYKGSQQVEEVYFRVLLFKLFNRIATWEALREGVGPPTWAHFDGARYASVLDGLFSAGERLYAAAYIMPSPTLGHTRKHQNHLALLEHMMRSRAPLQVARAKSLRSVFEVLRGYPSLGGFLAFQFAIDLNYSELIDFQESDFVVAGPGARNGIRKCFTHTADLDDDDVIRIVAERAELEFAQQGLSFQSLWGRPLQLIDCQNLFCEVDKYARVAHPELKSLSKRTRIKQRFSPNPEPLDQWYPPKWSLPIAESAPEERPAPPIPVQLELS